MKKKIIYILLFSSLALSAKAQSLQSSQSPHPIQPAPFPATYTLPQCLEMARQHNRTLQNAALEIEAAGEQQKEAYTKYFPQISANVTAFQAFDKILKGDGTLPQTLADMGEPFASMAGMPVSIRELNRGYAATLSAMQPLYTGGQLRTGNELAALQKDVMQLQLSLKEKDVLQQVTENYWQIAQVKYNLRTLDAADRQLAEVCRLVNDYVSTGVTTRNDLLKVKLHQQELLSNRIKLENAEHILKMLLQQRIGVAPAQQAASASLAASKGTIAAPSASEGVTFDIALPDDSLLSANTIMVPSGTDGGAVSRTDGSALSAMTDGGVSSRPEYHLALKAIDAQRLQVKMERGRLLPTVAVGVMGYNAGFGGLSSTVKNYINTNMTNGLVLGTVSVPISDWWGGKHAIKRQRLKLQEAQNTALDVQEQLTIDITSAWSNVVEAYKQIEVCRSSVEQAAENLRISTDQYRAGTETLSDLLDAETLNRRAQDNLSSALATYQMRLSDYQRKVQ